MGLFRNAGRLVSRGLKPTQKLRLTRAGLSYLGVWIALMAAGLHQQVNLILLVAGLAFGPLVASYFVSLMALWNVRVVRRVSAWVFSGEPLAIDYSLANASRFYAALALSVEDLASPLDKHIPDAAAVLPAVDFARVAPGTTGRLKWQGPTPGRGRYRFSTLELVTRSPFGLMERRKIVPAACELLVYPKIGQLARRWNQIHRESNESTRGHKHDRSAQQQEYHGLRDYRPGDSQRLIHWRTTARIGKPMVKEFEQEHDQALAILIDPWLPRTKVTAEQREALEASICFAATVCLETCRHAGRRLLLGWTGPTPGVRQGPASIKLLHDLLEQLAVMQSSSEAQVSSLLDALPPAMLRDAVIVLVSTRAVNLAEEAENTVRLAGGSARGMVGRILNLDSSRGVLTDLIQLVGGGQRAMLRPKEAVNEI